MNDIERLRDAIDRGDATYYSGDIREGLLEALDDLIDVEDMADDDEDAIGTIHALRDQVAKYKAALEEVEEAKDELALITNRIGTTLEKFEESKSD